MILKELTKYLEDNSTFTIGTNLFAGHRPSGISVDCITILNTTGGYSDFYLIDKLEIPLQFISRSINYYDAFENAKIIYDLLNGKSGITLPVVTSGREFLINTIISMNAPYFLNKNQKGQIEISFNLRFHVQETP